MCIVIATGLLTQHYKIEIRGFVGRPYTDSLKMARKTLFVWFGTQTIPSTIIYAILHDQILVLAVTSSSLSHLSKLWKNM